VQEHLDLVPGRVVGLSGPIGSGLTHLAFTLLAAQPSTVAYVDVLGWLCPVAAWEAGLEPDRLIVVRCSNQKLWPQVVGALVDGVPSVYAEVPEGVGEAVLRRLAALTRARGTTLLMRPLQGELPEGVAFPRIRSVGIEWEGTAQGHGRLRSRQMTVDLSGKGAPPARVEVETDGALRVVSRVASSRYAIG